MDPLQYYDLHWRKEHEPFNSAALGTRDNSQVAVGNVDINGDDEFPLPDVEQVGDLVESSTAHKVRQKVCELLEYGPVDRFPGSQPISFDQSHLDSLLTQDYYVCEKSDGIRYLMLALMTERGPKCYLIDRKNDVRVVNVHLPFASNTRGYHHETLFDGELVVDVYREFKQTRLRFLIFDLMALNSQSLVNKNLSYRFGKLQSDVMEPYKRRLRQNPDAVLQQHFEVRMKNMQRSYASAAVLEQEVPKLHHGNDGLIFTPVYAGYICGTFDLLLKWKPAELCTVDFKIRVDYSMEHSPRYMLQLLVRKDEHQDFCSLNPEPELAAKWRTLPTSPDGRIGEFKFDSEWPVESWQTGYGSRSLKGGWRFLRFRDDKLTANHVKVYERIMHSLNYAASKEQLLALMPEIRRNWKTRELLPPPTLITLSNVHSKHIQAPIPLEFSSYKVDFTHPSLSLFIPTKMDVETEDELILQHLNFRPQFKALVQ